MLIQETPAETPGERLQETRDERPREEPIDPLMFRYFLFETNLTLNTKQAGRGGHLASPPFFGSSTFIFKTFTLGNTVQGLKG